MSEQELSDEDQAAGMTRCQRITAWLLGLTVVVNVAHVLWEVLT